MNTKRLLYIGTPIFNYHSKIIAEFEKQGYSVDYYNDRPSENSFVKGAIKLRPATLNGLINRYFDRIMSETEGKKYNLVLIINCKVFTKSMIKRLRDRNKSTKFVLYMWDSLDLYPHIRSIIPLFDKSYSFDSLDCANKEGLEFLPLFYSDLYEKVGFNKSCVEGNGYDIVSICTVHPNRYRILRPLISFLERHGLKVYSYMYLNHLQFIYYKLFNEEFKTAKRREFKFQPLSEGEILTVLGKTKVVLDIQHNKQTGLTMRTIESLGARKKLITYNNNIKNYDFYNSENILILNDSNWSEIPKFLESPYVPIEDELYEKYRLSSWVKKIVE